MGNGLCAAHALEDRWILVTGAASGIGAACARAYAGHGANLILADRQETLLGELASELRDAGREVAAHIVDLSDPADVDAMFDVVAAEIPRLDGALLNAGINRGPGIRADGGRVEEYDRATWREILDINLDGAFFCLQRSAELMRPHGRGSIVVTGSTTGLRSEPWMNYAYSAAKAALTNVSKLAALDLSRDGIRVNVMAPGPFATQIHGPGPRPPEREASLAATVPLGRLGTPDEMAGLAVLLMSDAGSYMTGGVYPVDGGALALSQMSAPDLRIRQ